MRNYERSLGWIFLFMTPLVLPTLLIYLCQLLPVQPDDAQKNALSFAVNFLLTVLIFHHFLWQNAKQALQRPEKTILWTVICFAAYNISTNLLSLLTKWLAPDFVNANDTNILTMLQERFWLMAVCVVILVPITEETLYRGLIFGSLRKRSRWLAYVVSACAFSALHLVAYIGSLPPFHLLVSFLQYLPGAVALAFAYDKTDSIWSSILIHSTINLLAMITTR